jgi:hypothetical protein
MKSRESPSLISLSYLEYNVLRDVGLNVCPETLYFHHPRAYYARPSLSIMPGPTWRDNGHKALCPLSQLLSNDVKVTKGLR